MKAYRNLAFLILTGIVITACGAEGSVSVHNNHHNDPVVVYDEPTLYEFHVIDTYGVNTEFDNEALALSPFVNGGEFEVFWDVESRGDYFTEIRFNTAPTTDRSRLISSEFCGPGFYCDTHQYQFCDYTTSFDIRCESSEGDLQSEYIGDLISAVPQEAFIIFQVCDTSFFYCEYDVLPVIME